MHEFFTFEDLDGFIDGEYFTDENIKLDLPQPEFHISYDIIENYKFCGDCKVVELVYAYTNKFYATYVD